MGLADKLEKRAKELDRQLSFKQEWSYHDSCFEGGYDLEIADDRELLEQAAKRIRDLEYKHHYV